MKWRLTWPQWLNVEELLTGFWSILVSQKISYSRKKIQEHIECNKFPLICNDSWLYDVMTCSKMVCGSVSGLDGGMPAKPRLISSGFCASVWRTDQYHPHQTEPTSYQGNKSRQSPGEAVYACFVSEWTLVVFDLLQCLCESEFSKVQVVLKSLEILSESKDDLQTFLSHGLTAKVIRLYHHPVGVMLSLLFTIEVLFMCVGGAVVWSCAWFAHLWPQ